jgi:hypothetical protein
MGAAYGAVSLRFDDALWLGRPPRERDAGKDSADDADGAVSTSEFNSLNRNLLARANSLLILQWDGEIRRHAVLKTASCRRLANAMILILANQGGISP